MLPCCWHLLTALASPLDSNYIQSLKSKTLLYSLGLRAIIEPGMLPGCGIMLTALAFLLSKSGWIMGVA